MQNKERIYVLQDVEVEGLSLDLTDLDTSKIYYYTVRAFDGTHYSPESDIEKVESLIAPTLKEAYMMENNSLYVNWDEVPNAGYYELQSFVNHTSEAEEEYTISNEKFDRISVGSEYSIYAPFADLPLEEELKDLADQAGWISSGAVRIDGAYGLDGYGYENYRKPIYLESPELDLSNNGGQFTINVDLLGVGGTRALARVLHVEGLKMVVDDKFEINDLTEEWKNYTIDLKNGTNKSYVEICCYGPSYMYMDNLKITQKLNVGDNILVPFVAGRIQNSCDTTITIPETAMKDIITYKVRSVKEVWDEYGYSLDHYVYSEFSTDSFDCKTTTSIKNVSENNDVRIITNGNQISIDNKNSENVAIYNTCGTLIYQNNTGNKHIVTNMLGKGIYLVKVGNKTIKMSI